MKKYLSIASFSQFLKDLKAVVEHELRVKRPWQSYVLASALVCGVLLTAQSVLGESPAPPMAEETAFRVELPPKPSPAVEEKVTEYHLEETPPATSSWERSTQTQASEDSVSQAVETVEDFYRKLDLGDTESAYAYLSPEFQRSLPYALFRDGYQPVRSLSSEVKFSEELSPDLVRLNLDLTVSESGDSQRYFVTCLVTRRQGQWTLSGMSQLRS